MQPNLTGIAHIQPKCEIQKIIECEKFFENYYPNPEIKDNVDILTDQLSPVNSLDTSSSESAQFYQEIKKDTTNLTGFTVTESFVQISLIFGIIVWGYDLQRIWKKH